MIRLRSRPQISFQLEKYRQFWVIESICCVRDEEYTVASNIEPILCDGSRIAAELSAAIPVGYTPILLQSWELSPDKMAAPIQKTVNENVTPLCQKACVGIKRRHEEVAHSVQFISLAGKYRAWPHQYYPGASRMHSQVTFWRYKTCEEIKPR